jgi:molybdopterin-guanine dinucleotide biosynthesis protein A
VSLVSAAVLIGGRAQRFDGVFKPGLRVGNQTILQRQLDVLAAAGIAEVMLVGRAPVAAPPGVHRVADAVEGCGPLGGVYSALLASVAPVVVVLAGDLPFVTPPLVRRLLDLGPDDDAAVPRGDRWHPLCAAYRRRVAWRLKRRIDRGALRVADALGEMRVREVSVSECFGPDAVDMLTNVNTPDEYARAERHARTTS